MSRYSVAISQNPRDLKVFKKNSLEVWFFLPFPMVTEYENRMVAAVVIMSNLDFQMVLLVKSLDFDDTTD